MTESDIQPIKVKLPYSSTDKSCWQIWGVAHEYTEPGSKPQDGIKDADMKEFIICWNANVVSLGGMIENRKRWLKRDFTGRQRELDEMLRWGSNPDKASYSVFRPPFVY